MLVTVNCTLATLFRRKPDLFTLHTPLLLVVHELLPLDPLLQLPVTFAPETGE